ncbi:MAG: hypothetical protein ACE5FW_01810, partial [Candidatus Aenigmatarchaeota archaeon]
MNLAEALRYYSREDVQSALIALSNKREVVGVYKNGEYSTRPNTLVYPQDILAMVRGGVLEFHTSIEHWSNPMAIKQGNYQELRTGWDLVFDVDCERFEHGVEGAKVLAWALEKHGVEGLSAKFTGGTGWHLGVPWAAIPKELDFKPTVRMFPDLARRVCSYLKGFTRERLEEAMLKLGSPEQLAEQAGKPLSRILDKKSAIDPWQVIELDPVLVSPRHLFRAAYSLHKNSGLVSVPVKPEYIGAFKREDAAPEKIDTKLGFLDRAEENEAEGLILETADWWRRVRKEERKVPRKPIAFTQKIGPELFPPCAREILKGVADGRKRSVFIMLNFLRHMRWGWPEIEQELLEWNK